MISVATSTWSGDWHSGQGTIATAGPTIPRTSYTYASRFEGAPGAVPEELFAAAYAGCLNQAVANVLGWGNFTATAIETRVEFEAALGVRSGPPGVVRIGLRAVVPDIRPEQFQSLVKVAKDGCLMSRMLKDSPELTATLVQDPDELAATS